jgi:hypothetical protein
MRRKKQEQQRDLTKASEEKSTRVWRMLCLLGIPLDFVSILPSFVSLCVESILIFMRGYTRPAHKNTPARNGEGEGGRI